MKICPSCNKQNPDDSLFCSECGTKIPQDNVCPSCGASVNEGDVFCQNCGKKLFEVERPEQSSVEEYVDEKDNCNPFKKLVPYIIAICVMALLLGGAWWWNAYSTKIDKEIIVNDSTNVSANSKEEQIRKQLQSTCDFLINSSDEMVIEKYFSTEFKNLYKDVVNIDSKYNEPGFETYISSPGQDGEYTKAEVKLITVNSDTTAVADVLFTINCAGFIEKKTETFFLLFENDKWVIDDYQNYKDGFKEHIKNDNNYDNRTDDTIENADNYDWLQGHWIYEQGNYKGHFIINGNTITQFSSINPEQDESTFRIEGNELRARLIDGMDLVVKIDFINQRIDYGDGQWMHKIE